MHNGDKDTALDSPFVLDMGTPILPVLFNKVLTVPP